MNVTTSLSLQVVCQLIGFQPPYSNDANIVVSNPSAISNQMPPPVQPVTLPDAYIAYPEIDAAYKIIFELVDWSEAREQCNLEGAHLAIIDSERKVKYLRNTTYHTHHRRDTVIQMHTGIHRMDDKWVDLSTGKTLSDLPWKPGYPVAAITHNCAILQLLNQAGDSFTHNSATCKYKGYYICEVPIPKDYKTQENQMAQISFN